MADTVIGLSQIITFNDKNAVDAGCTDVLNDAPFLNSLQAITSSNGTQHKYLKETGAPNVGFRTPYHGIDHGTPTVSLVTIDLKIVDFSDFVDKAIADSYGKGGSEALIGRSLKSKLRQQLFGAEKAILNGDTGSSFNGLKQAVDSTMTIDAGGTTGSTSSAYLVYTNDDCGVQVVAGNEGAFNIDETVTVMAIDENGKRYPAYYTPAGGWLGLTTGSKYSVVRIKGLTAPNANGTASTNGLNDRLIYAALAKFPAGRQPNRIVAHPRDLANLQASRTAVSPTGQPAPRATDIEGITIVPSNALATDE